MAQHTISDCVRRSRQSASQSRILTPNITLCDASRNPGSPRRFIIAATPAPTRGVKPAYIITAVLAFFIAIIVIQNLPTRTTGGIDPTGRPTVGSDDAPVTMTIFEDFMCPGCQQFTLEMLPEIHRAYVTSGDVRIVHVNFPVVNATSTSAARTATCAHQQSNDIFWDLKAPLYRAQGTLNSERELINFVLSYAPTLDERALRDCINDPNTQDAITRDITDGRNIGVNQTPTVLINDQIVTPLHNQAIASAIEAALQQAR